MSACVLHPQGDTIPKTPGAPPAPDSSRISAADAEQYVSLHRVKYKTVKLIIGFYHIIWD